MVARADVARGAEKARELGGIRLLVGALGDRVGRDAVTADAASFDLVLEVSEGAADAIVETLPGAVVDAFAMVGEIGEEILRVVEQAHVERLQAEALERAVELIGEEARMNAVPAIVAVLDHLVEGQPLRLAPSRQLQ